MTTIGIEIDGHDAILIILEKDKNGTILQKETSIKKIELKNDMENLEVKQFQEVVYSHFKSQSPDKIGIIRRNAKGQKAASPMSFKLEGIIQLYDKIDIQFIHPATIRAFLKKNPLPFEPKFKYQTPALELAHYLLFN